MNIQNRSTLIQAQTVITDSEATRHQRNENNTQYKLTVWSCDKHIPLTRSYCSLLTANVTH